MLAKEQLEKIYIVLEKSEWNKDKLQEILLKLVDNTGGWKRAPFFANLRLTIAGSTVSPPLIESMEIIGKEECLKRIKQILEKL